MSISQFLDDMPASNDRNYSCFYSKRDRIKHLTVNTSRYQILEDENSNCSSRNLNNQRNQSDEQVAGQKRELSLTTEDAHLGINKRQKTDF